jgi:ribonuclease-3
VRAETLAVFSAQLDLGRYLVMGKGEEIDGGRSRPSILADAFEAVLGAVYLEGGVDAARRVVVPLLERAMEGMSGKAPLDYKSALQIAVQGRLGITPVYRTVAARGPDHARVFQVEVVAGELLLGTGEGASKQIAQQEAARLALERFSETTAEADELEQGE